MYTYVTSYAKAKKAGSRWTEVNIKNMQLNDIFANYSKVYAVLNNTFFTGSIGFDLETIKDTYYHSTLTFAQFLMWLENKALPHMNKIPSLQTRLVKYADAFHAGYAIKAIHKTASPESPLPRSEKAYLHLTKADVDYDLFYNNCMVTVNGYIHLTDADTNGVYVVDGNKSAVHANQNQMGIYSFREVGTIENIPITESMISRQLDNIPLSNKIYIKLPEKIGTKLPILVLGGYMHIFDPNTFYMVDEQTLCINFMNYRFLDRYYESKEYIDLTSLPLDKYKRNESQLDLENFFSDEVIKAYLTLSQSFIVLLDASDVFAEHVAVDNTPMPGMMITTLKPELPLIGGHGRLLDYWYTYEDRQYSIACVDDLVNTRVYNTTNWYNLQSVADSRIPTDRVKKSNAHFLRIGVDIEA